MPDVKPTHNHWKRKCSICKSLINWCSCQGVNPDTGSMITLHGICQKCVDAAKTHKDAGIELKRLGYYFNEKKELRIDPNTPLRFKEYICKVGPFFFYYVDEDEIVKKYTGEFVEAGNYMRFKFIPNMEFYFDVKLDEQKQQHAFLHEPMEVLFWLAFYGAYDPAHYAALEDENLVLSGINTPVQEYLQD